MGTRQRTTDLRFIKTRRAIRAALLELLSQAGVDEISSKDVAERARITKKTFLAHYASVRDAVDELEDEALERVEEVFAGQPALTEAEIVSAIGRMAEAVEDKANVLGALLSSKVRDETSAKIQALLRDHIAKTIGPGAAESLAPDFLAGGIVSAFGQWLHAERRPSPQELGRRAAAIFRSYPRPEADHSGYAISAASEKRGASEPSA